MEETIMRKMNKKEKIRLLKELKQSGWNGCMCDECLLKIAKKVLDYQEKIQNETMGNNRS